jgi:ABC-type multidrug transport system ATPase subunit
MTVLFRDRIIKYIQSWLKHQPASAELPLSNAPPPNPKSINPLVSTPIKQIEYNELSAGTWLASNSGKFEGGKLNAVMGSSGCGKSTLIELMRGRVNASVTKSGTVRVVFAHLNDSLEFDVSSTDSKEIKAFRKLVGFVPQDDLVYADLTVRENLLYSAKLKRPGLSEADYADVVNEVSTVLSIDKIAEKLVGSPEKRSISGGQRKRVNIGMELVGRHPIIFMDEPTSGLDSTGSYTVMKYCRDSARKHNQCFVCVIHQPKFSTFMLFDNLSLLGKGGTVFAGTPCESLVYFNTCLGTSINPDENPADVLMDLITYGFKSRFRSTTDSKIAPTELPELWKSAGQAWVESLRTSYPDMTKLLTSPFRYEPDETILNTPIMTASDIIDFFERTINTHVSYKDVSTFLQNKSAISNREFISVINDVCTEATLNSEYSTLIDRINGLPFKYPDSILFDGQIDRWRELRVYVLVVAFINRLKTIAKIDSKPAYRRQDEIFKKEMLLATVVGSPSPSPPHEPTPSLNSSRSPPSVLRRIVTLLNRRVLSFDRSPWFVQLLITTVAALIVGGIHGATGALSNFPGNIAMAMAAIGVLGTVTHIRTFAIDKAVIGREIKNGIEITAIYLAYNIVDLLWVSTIPSVFFTIYTYMTYPTANTGWFIWTGMLVEWWVSGLAYFISMMPLGIAWANLVGVFVSIIMGAFLNGLNPTIATAAGTFMEFILGLSYNRWAMEVLTIKEAETRLESQSNVVYGLIDRLGICGGSDNFESDPIKLILALWRSSKKKSIACEEYVNRALWILFAEGFALRLFAYAALWLTYNRLRI